MSIPLDPRKTRALLLLAMTVGASAPDPAYSRRCCVHGVPMDESCLACVAAQIRDEAERSARNSELSFAISNQLADRGHTPAILTYTSAGTPLREPDAPKPLTPEQLAAEEKRARKAIKLEKAADRGGIRRAVCIGHNPKR